ncbi:hypothetical protein M409DRAFT_66074 [Zasmidium cellare ATCC 36951]|uniref:Alpha/beta hydrolase fold-3 domain-containing protein n=1 Tax=Zasmidium cellare ATCC 36951 TaxID=1080233 RepID=A0A6A6CLP8_ZASCE|nr:uncharacterized protein M409DRAFT_66074 [Zasmidium cellare ATCC 36951]KAF2167563.1 hypothetical protein M409DRAFT_66074 [Zasmidium cellare ATCC 36951]
MAVPIDDRFPLSRLDDEFVEYYYDKLASLGTNLPPWVKDTSGHGNVKDITVPSDDGHFITISAGPYPVHINLHGGGFVLGNLRSDAHLCAQFCDVLGIMVLDVDYRLAPAHTIGRGHDDAWAAVRWVYAHAAEINTLPDSISLGGISAGGHISASLVPSLVQNEFAPCLNWERIKWFANQYTPQTEQAKAKVSNRPAFFKRPIEGNLAGLSDTFLATADCDPCRDEGEALGMALLAHGVKVTMRRYMGVPHPFMHMQPIRKAQLYVRDVCEALRSAHARI